MGWRQGTAIRLAILTLVGIAAFWLSPILGVVVIVAGGFLFRTAMERCDSQGLNGDDVVSEIGDGGVTSDLQLEGTSLDTATPRPTKQGLAPTR